MRRALGVVAGLLFVGLAVLVFKQPSFVIKDDGEGAVHVSCGSLIAVGWPSDSAYLDDEGSTHWNEDVTTDRNLGTEAWLGIARECSERRDTYLAFAVIVASAANLAVLAAFMTGRTAALRGQLAA